MLDKVIGLMADCLEKDIAVIKPEDEFRSYPEWDSLAYLAVIAAIDEVYNYVVPLEDFRSCRTVMALAEYLDKQLGNR